MRQKKNFMAGYMSEQQYNIVKVVKRRRLKDRCVCGHFKHSHESWTGRCYDVFEKTCECVKFISEKEDSNGN